MALFHQLADLADLLATTSSRLKKRAAIAEAIQRVRSESDAHNAGLFALYLSGTPFAEADSRKLNTGGAMLSKIVREITQATDTQITAAYRCHGDFGAASHDLYIEQSHMASPTITLTEIEETFNHAATAKTTAIRQSLLTTLLQRATPIEAKYLIKLMLGDMRIGVKQSLVEEAIAVATENSVAEVRNAVMLEADLARTTQMAFDHTLHTAHMRLFHPLGFMLASPVDTPEDAIKRFSSKPEVAAEADVSVPPATHVEPNPLSTPSDAYALENPTGDTTIKAVPITAIHIQAQIIQAQIEDKYDGMRVQLHCGDPSQPKRVALYSRNREDVTASYPEIAEAFANVADTGIGPLILDGELLAWEIHEARALSFAVLSPRIGRKRVTNDVRRSTPVVFMAFDLLYADGQLLLEIPLRQRRNRLEAIVEKLLPITVSPLEIDEAIRGGLFDNLPDTLPANNIQRLHLSPTNLAQSADDLDRAYTAARARGNEGVMIKAADSLYQPGRRGLSWLKLKRELATLDVVITGAEYGHGRRAQLLSDYTFAIRGPASAEDRLELLNVGKAYSGVTDAEILELTEWLKAHTLEDHGHFRTIEPQIILEVAFNNIMRSDRHASGFALRFPRILRIRTDKPLAEIDTLERVEELYQSQPDKPVES